MPQLNERLLAIDRELDTALERWRRWRARRRVPEPGSEGAEAENQAAAAAAPRNTARWNHDQ